MLLSSLSIGEEHGMNTYREWTREDWQEQRKTSVLTAKDPRVDLRSGGPRAGSPRPSTLRDVDDKEAKA